MSVLKVDLGCERNTLSGYVGVDVNDYPGVDEIVYPWNPLTIGVN